jgi:hypothetical protein
MISDCRTDLRLSYSIHFGRMPHNFGCIPPFAFALPCHRLHHLLGADLPKLNTLTHPPLRNYSQCRSEPHPRQARTVVSEPGLSVRDDLVFDLYSDMTTVFSLTLPGQWALISVNDHRSSFTSKSTPRLSQAPGMTFSVRGTVLQRKV